MTISKQLRRLAAAVGLAGVCQVLLSGCTPPEYTFDNKGTAGSGQGGSGGSGGGVVAPSCRDEEQNGEESDIDCGGMTCPRCETGQLCNVGDDCVDFVCTDGECAPPSCSDGLKNGLESATDCGGDCDPCGGSGTGGAGGDGAGGSGGATAECESDNDCNDSDVCTNDACVSAKCEHTNNTAPCASDQLDCTDDVCADGICEHVADDTCDCYVDTDCDDGNLCTDETCENHVCVPTNNNDPCESDNVACTVDLCTNGTCEHEPDGSCECEMDADCDDTNVCTDDVCEAYVCQTIANTDPCATDSIDCTVDVCSAGRCEHQPDGTCDCLIDADCDDTEVCTNDACVNYACQITNNTNACDSDNIACTIDVCGGGVCNHNPTGSCQCLNAGNCNDSNACTDDDCVGYACTHTNNTAPCATDGIACTVDVCSAGACTHVSQGCGCNVPADCNDGNPCTNDDCVNFSCQITNNTDPCTTDNIACTTDVCGGGICNHNPSGSCQCLNAGNCNDGNLCTDDDCVDYACTHTNNTSACDTDNIACTNDICSAGGCTHPPTLSCECTIDAECDDLNACTDNACVDYACEDTNNTDPCTADSIDCTDDQCAAGICTHEPTGACECLSPANCNDSNACTDDACTNYACVSTNNTAACTTDNIACTSDVCGAGACNHNPTGACECTAPANCNDNNVCTDNTCVDYACVYPNNTATCATDNIACTTDVCSSGTCTHVPTASCGCMMASDCNDNNVCTTDACTNFACVYTNNSNSCATDSNECTDDVCSGGACTHPNKVGSCTDDGDTCTNDTCSGGVCTHPDKGLCNRSNFVVIRTDRDDKYVVSDYGDPVITLNRIIEGATAATGTVTVNWDATTLYFVFNITDNTVKDDSANHWEDDSVEIYIDADNGKTGTFQSDDHQLTFARSGGAIQGATNGANTGAMTVTYSSNATSYTVNVTIPWTAIASGSLPVDGIIGVDFALNDDNDADATRDGQIMWNGDSNNYTDPSDWGSIALNSGTLKWTGSTQGGATVFEKIDEVSDRFILREQSSGLYVALGGNDDLGLVTSKANAAWIDTDACGTAPFNIALRTPDADGGDYLQNIMATEGNVLRASANSCSTNADSWERYQLIPITLGCTVPGDCDDANPCTTETCTANFCVYTDTSAACVSDGQSCTTDVCSTGTCTHLDGSGGCTGSMVNIYTNHDTNFVKLNGIYLENTAVDATTAEDFEVVASYGGLFRLRSATANNFVVMDVNDELTTGGTFAAAAVFDSYACSPPHVALEVMNDNDTDRNVSAEDTHRLKARNPTCSLSTGSYEKFQLLTAN